MRKNTRTRRQQARQQTRRRLQRGGDDIEDFLNAVIEGDYQTTKDLIEAGADVNFQNVFRENTPLHHAVFHQHEDIVRLLLEHGADPNRQTRFGDTPLHDAVENWFDDIAILLVENGADPNIRDSYQKRPLDLAIDRGNEDMIEYLYSRTNDPNNYRNINLIRYYNENNNENTNENNNENNENYNENGNSSENNNNTKSNFPAVSAGPLGTTTITEAPKQCFDPIMLNTANIVENNDTLIIYVRNKAGKITNSYCVDADYLTKKMQSDSEVFYKCKDDVKMSAHFIQPKNVHYDSPLQRIAMDIHYFTKRDQCQKMQLGKSYVLQETDEPVGRIASRAVVKGASIVSAKHCGPDEPGHLYEILEVVKTGGRRKTRRNTRRNRKH